MNKRVFLIAMTSMVLVVTGCSTTGGERWHPALCALAGAAAGGAAGAIANDNTAGAMGAVGGIAGALVCATRESDGDSDGDGVRDSLDACAGTRRGAEVDSRGCEIQADSDGDGVVDGSDDCPNTPAGTRVNASGCAVTDAPSDRDGDGVADDNDDCPNTPRGASVDSRGCELDSDGDGVKDSADRCPGTAAGTPVNNQGCELEETFTLVGVGFEFDSAQLTADARAKLDEDVRILLRHPELVVELAGHTDSRGSESYNQTLSEERANAVRSYLISRGADGSKITARGYGESQPAASNETEAGRSENRRVELRQR